jgi:hypothetical protein
MELGSCSKIHSDDLKREYEKTLRDRSRYEEIAERELMTYISEADRKIKVETIDDICVPLH